MENNHEVTNEELARIIGEGFHGVDEKFTSLSGEMNQRFDKVDERLEHIEKFLLEEHRRRIEKLEDQVKELRDALAMK